MKRALGLFVMAGVCTYAPATAQAALNDFQYSMVVQHITRNPEAAFGQPVGIGRLGTGLIGVARLRRGALSRNAARGHKH